MLQLARTEDQPAVERMAKHVHSLLVSWHPDLYWLPEGLYSADRFADAVSNRKLYVAKENNIVLGYAKVDFISCEGAGVINRKVMTIQELCVDEPFRNRGIGTQIVSDVKALARAFGCANLQLSVYPQNDAAVSFFQKCGLMIHTIQMQMNL